MNSIIIGGVVSFILAIISISFWRHLAVKKSIFITPIRVRDSHIRPTPRVGGIALVITFLVVVFGWLLFNPSDLNFSDQTFFGIDKNLFGLMLAILLLTVVNLWDDYKGLGWQFKLLVQIAAALLVAYFGVKIQILSNPFGEPFQLGNLDWLFVVIWLVTLSNVVNWLDGIDGLAGGVSSITLVILLLLSLSPQVAQPSNALLASIALGGVLGFLFFNARGLVFLGDTGSVYLGFLIGVLAIISGGKVATAALVLAIPILDALVVLASRIFHGQSPFMADRRHLHHRLLDLGWKPRQIVLFFYSVSALLGLIALNTQTLGKFWALLAAAPAVFLLVLLYSVKVGRGSGESRSI